MLKGFVKQPLTVKQLELMLKKAIKEGHGDKYVFLSDDDEGNGFHALFYGITEDATPFEYEIHQIADKEDLKKIVILG
jgi:hypothetical protein